jgi:Bacterial Ig-like domain (group 3)
VPTGTVTLTADSQKIAALTLSSGSASVTVSTAGITPGSYTVTAAYSGSAGYQPSSTTTTVTVQWPTTTALSVQPNPVVQGGTLTLVATVARTGNSNEPTGAVQFKVGSNIVGSASVAGGTASLSIPTGTISQGTYGVTAAYSGDADDGASNSALVDVKID